MKTNFEEQKMVPSGLKDNVRKTALHTAAIIVSLALLSLTVSAQDFWKTLLLNSSINEIAMALSDGSGKTEEQNSESRTEETIDITKEGIQWAGPWMSSESFFDFLAHSSRQGMQIPLWQPEKSLRQCLNATQALLVPLKNF